MKSISTAARKLIFKSVCFCIFTVTVACLVGIVTNNLPFGFFFSCITLFSVAMLYTVVKWKYPRDIRLHQQMMLNDDYREHFGLNDINNNLGIDRGGLYWSIKSAAPAVDYHPFPYGERDAKNVGESNHLCSNVSNSNQQCTLCFKSKSLLTITETIESLNKNHVSTRTIPFIPFEAVSTPMNPLLLTEKNHNENNQHHPHRICCRCHLRNKNSGSVQKTCGATSETNLESPPPYEVSGNDAGLDRHWSRLPLYEDRLGPSHRSQSENAVHHFSLIKGIDFYYFIMFYATSSSGV